MLLETPSTQRELKKVELSADMVIVGGGAAGTCCAITSSRAGLRVVLVHDRPVLGGNASSEVRLWLLGATTHMGSNNRWAREGGVINEIMMENLWRNPEGNPLIFDTVLLEKVLLEKNITLLLNTACFEVQKKSPDRISGISAYCSQNETLYQIASPLFCDASGDGVVGFLAGGAFRMGAEAQSEFGEKFAPTGEFGHLLGHSIYFYSKDTGRPVKFVAPSFALTDIENAIPRYRSFNTKEQGCRLWWLEWGGRLDTIHETEKIKWELWRVVYGVWNYIKNSGKFPEAENLTLEWVGHIPGKRESRRFEGDYMLTQQDVVERRQHPDGVAFGGWSIDLHPAEGVFAKLAGSHHLHSKGIYQIPYRCFYSRNIENLFLAGRIISASHVAFGSTRVMATCAHGAQAVAQAAALCHEHGELPRDLLKPERMTVLQQRLGRDGHHLPGINAGDHADLARQARITASSTLRLSQLPPDGPLCPLDQAMLQMIPLPTGRIPALTFQVACETETSLDLELLSSSNPWHHTPDVVLSRKTVPVSPGPNRSVTLDFGTVLENPGYVFVRFPHAEGVAIHTSASRITGLLRLVYRGEESTEHVGGERYHVYCPERRPGGQNFAMHVEPPLEVFQPENILNGWQRPTSQANAWVAALDDKSPIIHLEWKTPQTITETILYFDGDFDHAMETVLWGHPERAVPFCVKRYEILDDKDNVLASVDDHHHSVAHHTWPQPITTSRLSIRILETWGAPPALFEVRCYA
ncbi:hypothetical protein BH09VER1_BH09VER1_38030 [soil metagenome]